MQFLNSRDLATGEWREALLESRRASPAEMAAVRIDFQHWLSTLSVRDRAIALALAAGEKTYRVAARFALSCGRIAQMRRELAVSWFALHGLDSDGCESSAIAA